MVFSRVKFDGFRVLCETTIIEKDWDKKAFVSNRAQLGIHTRGA
jgi:hypothetical protein